MEELEKIPALSSDDPRRIDAERCPRCAARLAALRLFNDLSRPAPGADPEDAERRLKELLAPGRLPRNGRRRILSRRWWLLVPAAAVVLLMFVLPRDASKHASPPVLRGETQLSSALPRGEGGWTADGSLDLSWPPFDGAEQVEVVFFALDLAEIARVPAPDGTSLHLEAADLPPTLRQRKAVFWSAIAIGEGHPIGRTARQLLEQ